MRKPARVPLILAESLHHLSVLVSRDLAGRAGTGQDGAGWDGCSHSVPHQKAGSRLAGLHVLAAGAQGRNSSPEGGDR